MELHQELKDFIAEARRNCWAAGLNEAKPLHPGSKRHAYDSKGGLRYEDEYFGGRQFHGMEVVYAGARAMWVMSYQGFVSWGPTGFFDTMPKDVYRFLREALFEKADEARLSVSQEPIRFQRGLQIYENIPDASGHSSVISGRESITLNRFILLYQGTYMGCLTQE